MDHRSENQYERLPDERDKRESDANMSSGNDGIDPEMPRHTIPKKEKPDIYGASVHARDVNTKTIFENAELTCQFLKDYSGLKIFENLTPEDIEDVTSRYQAFLGVEFFTDSVKKVLVRVREKKEEIYVIPLIEHKSQVDYDVQMQLLRYMAVIWYDYGVRKNAEVEKRLTEKKEFRYPPIIPIVYYEGIENWTADTNLWERIEHGEELKEFIPDFTYKVIRLHDFTKEELQRHPDEMSLVMMFNRIQTSLDYSEFLRTSRDYMSKALKDTPQGLMTILKRVFWALLMKMNVPQEEAQVLIKHMEEKEVGYLFENAEKMDIQAERRKTKEAQKEAEEAIAKAKAEAEEAIAKAKAEAEEAKAEAEEAKAEAEEAKAEAEEAKVAVKDANDAIEKILDNLIALCVRENLTKEKTRIQLQEKYGISDYVLQKYFDKMWNNK